MNAIGWFVANDNPAGVRKLASSRAGACVMTFAFSVTLVSRQEDPALDRFVPVVLPNVPYHRLCPNRKKSALVEGALYRCASASM